MSRDSPELRLRAYSELLAGRAVYLGLISESDRDRVLERHVEDSLRAAPLVGESDAVVDIGSGAGLPGIPLAVALPGARFVLIEARRRAVAFLELAVERLSLANVEVAHGRVEDLDLEADTATARAFGPIERSWEAAVRVLRPGGRLIYFAGTSFDLAQGSSLTDPEPPAWIEVAGVETSTPLAIMAREE